MLKPAKTRKNLESSDQASLSNEANAGIQNWKNGSSAVANLPPTPLSHTSRPANQITENDQTSNRFRLVFPQNSAGSDAEGNQAFNRQPETPIIFKSDDPAASGPILSALQQYGDFTLAYNTFAQSNLKYFSHSAGYIAFQTVGRDVLVVGDPIADPAELDEIIGSFLEKFPNAAFAQSSKTTAEVLSQHGFYLNEMGVETHLPLGDYNFDGKHKERIRYASNWLNRRGYQIVESNFDEMDTEEVKSVSDGWRKNMKYSQKEMGFLNRQIQLFDELDVRKFFLLDPEGKIVSFFFFDPLYRGGEIIGYSTAIKRRTADCPIYAEQGMMRHAVEKFIKEGKNRVNLGLSPLAWIKNDKFKRNPFLHFSFRMAFGSRLINKYFFNLQGHAKYKRHFKGIETPTYYASRSLFNDLKIFRILRLTGII